MSEKTDRLIIRLIIGMMIAAFIVGVFLIVAGYYIAQDDLMLKTKVMTAKVSTLMIAGFTLVVISIFGPFIGPALAKRIAGKK